MQLAMPAIAICALPVVPAPPTTMPRMPPLSLVEAMTALDGFPVSFASLFCVVPVDAALAISNNAALDPPKSRLLPSAPEMVGVVSVGLEIEGLVARTTLPLPVVALPVGVPVNTGLDSVGVDIVGLDSVA